jgi:colanic acid/amylovoran biosynthesis glycosyltransferase
VPSPPTVAQYVVTFLKPEMLHVYRQIVAMRAVRPVVICQKRENEDSFPFADVRILPKPWSHQLRRLWQKSIRKRPITIYGSEARRILAELRQIEARMLHVYFGHIGIHLLPLLELCAREGGPPVVVSFHGADAQVDLESPAHRKALARVFSLASRLLVRSESLGERLAAHGASREKIRLHRTGIPLGEIAFRPRSAPADGAWRCLQACRLIEKKGLETSLRAFTEFSRRWPHATFTIAGDGPQLESLRALADELLIGSKVLFPGFVSQPQLRALEAEAHLFLHPSELGSDGNQEGVPNAMLEAMASGLPVIATLHGGIPEAVVDSSSGFLVAERDHFTLAERMISLAADPDLYASMAAAAAKRVADEFDLSSQTARLEEIYREVL